jgi:hypothetical protein
MAIITTKDKMKLYLAISQNTELETINPYLNRADREFIIPEIGKAMFDDLLLYLADESSSSAVGYTADADLLARLEEVEVNFGFHLGFDMLAVHVSEAGIQRVESNDRKTAYQYQEQNLRQNLLESGHEVLGSTLEFLEENKDVYTTWAEDTEIYNKFKRHLINTPGVFQNYYDIQNSWAIFFKIRSIFTRVEDLYLEPILGEEFLTEIKDAIVADDTSDIADLLKLIQKAMAYLTISNALHTRIVQLGKDGFLEMRKNSTKNQSDENERLSSAIVENKTIGDQYLKKITEHLNTKASATVYQTYFESDLYQDATEEDYSTNSFTNSADGKSVII